MKITWLEGSPAVIAYDREANCYRCVSGSDCEVLNDQGQMVEIRELDTEEGYAILQGGFKKLRGAFAIFVKKEALQKYH